jgi:hypothetical protein
MGPPGAKGPVGTTGAKGNRGAQGPKGIKGIKGLKGPQGATGDKGAAGPAAACYAFETCTDCYGSGEEACSSRCCGEGTCTNYSDDPGGIVIGAIMYNTSACDNPGVCNGCGDGDWIVQCDSGRELSSGLIDGGNTIAEASECGSDISLKTGIKTLENSLQTIMSMRPVEYDWNELSPDYQTRLQSQKIHDIGFIAQDILVFYPQLVTEDGGGFHRLSYEKMNSILVEGIKEQQSLIDKISEDITYLSNIVK